MEDKNKAIDKLNQLLEKNYDAENGYRKAAENSESSLLRKILLMEAEKRHDFTIQIKEELAKIGGKPEEGDSTKAKIHRTWIDLKSAIAGNSDDAIIEECERGDKAAMKEYEEVLNTSELTASSRKLVQQQREEITARHHQWENLKK